MKKKFKKFLKFIIESTAVVIIILGIFSIRHYYGNKKGDEKVQVVNEEQNKTSQQSENNKSEENKKYSKKELDEALENIVKKYEGNNNISVVYKNFGNSYSYSHNEKEYYVAASTIKVLYAMAVYDRIRNNEITEDTQIPYNNSMLQEGGGEITNQPKKNSYPLDYVLMNMIKFSDNTATEMLVLSPSTAVEIKRKYFGELGIELPTSRSKNNEITPEMMGMIWEKLYNQKQNYSKLIGYLKETSDNEWIKNGISGKEIASKYGAINTYAHDTAIVFGKNSDYMLLIFTNNLAHSGDKISQMADEINKLTENHM